MPNKKKINISRTNQKLKINTLKKKNPVLQVLASWLTEVVLIFSLYAMDKPASPTGTAEILPVSTKQSTAKLTFLSHWRCTSLIASYTGGLIPRSKYDRVRRIKTGDQIWADYGKDKQAKERKSLSLQQEKGTKVNINDRTWAWVQTLRTADPKLGINRIEELILYLLECLEGKEEDFVERVNLYLLQLI